MGTGYEYLTECLIVIWIYTEIVSSYDFINIYVSTVVRSVPQWSVAEVLDGLDKHQIQNNLNIS